MASKQILWQSFSEILDYSNKKTCKDKTRKLENLKTFILENVIPLKYIKVNTFENYGWVNRFYSAPCLLCCELFDFPFPFFKILTCGTFIKKNIYLCIWKSANYVRQSWGRGRNWWIQRQRLSEIKRNVFHLLAQSSDDLSSQGLIQLEPGIPSGFLMWLWGTQVLDPSLVALSDH